MLAERDDNSLIAQGWIGNKPRLSTFQSRYQATASKRRYNV
jgi:hypothetical protein